MSYGLPSLRYRIARPHSLFCSTDRGSDPSARYRLLPLGMRADRKDLGLLGTRSGRWDLHPRPPRWQRDALLLSYARKEPPTRVELAFDNHHRSARQSEQGGEDGKVRPR